MTPLVAIVNHATTVTGPDLSQVIRALRHQVNDHLGPIWKVGARLLQVPKGYGTPKGAWTLILADETNEPGALGYHTDDLNVPPAGVIGIRDAANDGVPWSSVLSHELCEMLVDPWASLAAQAGNKMFALEVCDPVEGAPYHIDGIAMENFVLPDWFVEGSSGPWDFMNVLHGPFTLAPGGYSQSAKISNWEQQNADHARNSKRTPKLGSRRNRRIMALNGG